MAIENIHPVFRLNLDRFSQGLADPQEAEYRVCKCGAEVYDQEFWDKDYCETCAAEKIERFRDELVRLLEKHNMVLGIRGPNIRIIYAADWLTEEELEL